MKKMSVYLFGAILLSFTVAFTMDLQWRQVRITHMARVGGPGSFEQFYYPPTPSEELFFPTVSVTPEVSEVEPEEVTMVLASNSPIVPNKWKTFTSKRVSFIYPEGAEVVAEKQYLTGKCDAATAQCGSLTMKYKGIEFLHQPCTECSPGFYSSYTDKAVMIYGNNEDGILRTFATGGIRTDEGKLELTYFGIHNGILASIPVTIYVPFDAAPRYYYIADRMAASMFNQGKDIGVLPEASFYPVTYTDDCTNQVAEDGSTTLYCINNVELIDKNGVSLRKFSDNSTAILSPTGKYLALGNATFFNLSENALIELRGTLGDYVGYDQDSLGSWITPEAFLLRDTVCQVDPLIYCETTPVIDMKTGIIGKYSREKANQLHEESRNPKYELSNWY